MRNHEWLRACTCRAWDWNCSDAHSSLVHVLWMPADAGWCTKEPDAAPQLGRRVHAWLMHVLVTRCTSAFQPFPAGLGGA